MLMVGFGGDKGMIGWVMKKDKKNGTLTESRSNEVEDEER